jgi:hypothetical protein
LLGVDDRHRAAVIGRVQPAIVARLSRRVARAL